MAIWYLNADTGDDTTGDGSSSSPWATINHAHGMASSGDTILLQDSISVYIMQAITFEKSLTIQGESVEGVVVDSNQATRRWLCEDSSIPIEIHTITFKNLRPDSTYSNVIDIDSSEIHHCVFVDSYNSRGGNAGIVGAGIRSGYAANFNVNIHHNLFYGMSGKQPVVSGAHHTSGGNNTGTFKFSDNTVYCDQKYEDASPGSMYIYSWGNVIGTFKNNIFYSTKPIGIRLMAQPAQHTVANNSFHNMSDSTTTIPADQVFDPLFVDAPNRNFALRPQSPAIDGGTL